MSGIQAACACLGKPVRKNGRKWATTFQPDVGTGLFFHIWAQPGESDMRYSQLGIPMPNDIAQIS
jgi:hypothetical protein